MSSDGNLPSAMRPIPRQWSSQPLTPADAEQLLAGRGPHPEAPAVQHAIAGLLDSAAGPADDQELAGEVAAVAAFVLANGGRAPRSADVRARAWRRQAAVAGGVLTAAVLAFSGAAASSALPVPIQKLAHTMFDAPAPRPSAPLSKATLSPGQPAPAASPSPESRHGEATATGKKATGKKSSPKASPRGKAKGQAVPPGHKKG